MISIVPLLRFCSGLGLLVLLAGCVTRLPKMETLPVGPRESAGGFFSRGSLQVFTATEEHNEGRILYYPHSSYWVYNFDNQLVQFVPNHVGVTDQAATVIVLPAGRYKVVGRAEGYGLIAVPVVVYGGKTTSVYLERDGMPETSGVLPDEVVRLPGGYIIGWRAKESNGKSRP